MRFWRQNHGTTLLEVIITALLVTVLSIPTVEICIRVSRLTQEGSFQTVAMNLAQGKLEELKALSWDELEQLEGSHSSEILTIDRSSWVCHYQISTDDPIGGPGAVKQIVVYVYRLSNNQGEKPCLEATLTSLVGRY